MWLERFSGQSAQSTQSTPSGGTPARSFSPAPRRSVQLGPGTLARRPGLSPRTSSLGQVLPTGSTESLPATARLPQGSSLRKELASTPVQDVRDPVEVLQGILGPLPQSREASGLNSLEVTEGDLDSLPGETDFGELSLQEFANASLQSAPSRKSTSPAISASTDFEKDKGKFEDLHKSILACDEVLNSVEDYLTSFRADLAVVSAEIETLQNRSSDLNTKLENRNVVEKALGPEVESLAIAPSVVRKITEGTIDDTWVRALEELDKRSKSIDAKLKAGKEIKAAQDVRPFIEEISNKAVERARDYVIAQIKALRSPNVNAQVIQQTAFLRYKALFAFLTQQQPQLAGEISQAYINTMRWYYSHHFARYRNGLEKLNLHIVEPSETIAADPAKRVVKAGTPHDTFSLGRRQDALQASDHAALPSYLAEEDKSTHYLETPFKAFNLALVDNASAEYSFLSEFFPKQSYHATNRKFSTIFQPTLDLGLAYTKQLIDQSTDGIGILTCVRLNQRFAFELQRRKVPAMDGYINGTNMLLWPRFQQIIDAHRESIRKSTAYLPGKPAGTALSLTSSSASAQTTAPHPLTQRFANFTQAILTLSSEAGDDEPVSNSLTRLRSEFEAFLVKLSKGIAEARKRERFLYNNYSLVCTIVADTEGKLASDFKEHFTGLKDALGIDV